MLRFILLLLLILVLLLIAGIATGYINVNQTKRGDIDVDTQKVVVGTKETQLPLPKVELEKQTVRVPAVGVKQDGAEQNQAAPANQQ